MGHMILALDDESDILNLLSEALSEEGHCVVGVGSIAEAERAMRDMYFDLYILDLMVPGGNGMDLARRIRETSHAGIIILSGRSDQVDRVVGLELGADDYIAKPFHLRELRARVKAVLRRTAVSVAGGAGAPESAAGPNGAEAARLVEFHDFEMNMSARRLTRIEGGAEVALTTLEYEVLKALALNRNRVMSRDDIMQAVRREGHILQGRPIDGIVSRLRQKLYPEDERERRIKTVRGIGYILAV